MQEVTEQILSYIKGAWRYRWYGILLAWVIAIVGWAVVYRMPDRYEASARIYVDTQSILKPLLAGLAIQPNVDQMVSMMARTLLSRPNIEKVIRMADLDVRLKTAEERDQYITSLTGSIAIRGSGRENLYYISAVSVDPQVAKRIVQSLLTIFVEGSLGDKRKDSDSARRFLDDQIKGYADKLTVAESAITEFKRKHAPVGMMPQDGRGYYTRLGESKALVSQAELELREAENARDAIKKQLSGENDMPSLLDEKGPAEPYNPELDARIQALQQKLDGLRLTYTEAHPDIISIHRIIAQLREQKKEEAKTRKPSSLPAVQAQNPIQQQLTVSLATAEASVASMKARVAEYARRYEALKGAVHSLPQIEVEYAHLVRDESTIRGNLERLLQRRETAQMGADMEANASIVDFRVIDPPTVPSTPSAPRRGRLMSMVLLAALAGGMALAFLISQLRPTFNDERKLREMSGLPVFGLVVMAWSQTELAKRRKHLIAFVCSLISLLSAYGAIMAALTLAGRA